MPTNDRSSVNSSGRLAPAAFRALRYADWQPGVLCRLPASYPSALRSEALPGRRRRVARASMAVALQTAPRWTMTDTASAGAAAYRIESVAAPLSRLAPWQQQILEAIHCLRRWHVVYPAALPACVPQRSLDGCHCADCLTDAAPRAAWQTANRARIRREQRQSRARALTVARWQRSEARIARAAWQRGSASPGTRQSADLAAFNAGAAGRQRHRSAT